MPLRVRHVSEKDAPKPNARGGINEDVHQLKSEMMRLASGSVLEIEAGSEQAVRGIKTLVTRASNELGSRWRHWHVGSKVFAKPGAATRRRRGRPKKS